MSSSIQITIREVTKTLTMDAADTFKQSAFTLSDVFSAQELERGVYPVSCKMDLDALTALSAASTCGYQAAQITRLTQTGLVSITTLDLLYKKSWNVVSGAAAGLVHDNGIQSLPGAHEDPQGFNPLWASRVRKIDKSNPDTSLYLGISSSGFAAAKTVRVVVKFAIMPAEVIPKQS